MLARALVFVVKYGSIHAFPGGNMRWSLGLICCLLVLILAPMRLALAQSAPILDAARVLGLPASNNADLERFLRLNTPRAFAVGPNGAMGWQAGGGDAALFRWIAIWTGPLLWSQMGPERAQGNNG
jgi:hypothetical protein